MHNIYRAAELLTSNLIYSHITQFLCDHLSLENALLLNNVSSADGGLEIVDVRGALPDNLDLHGLKPILDELPNAAVNLKIKHPLGKHYHNLIKFQSQPGNAFSYFLFSGTFTLADPELKKLIDQITHIFEVKNGFDSLSLLSSSQSRLKYQLNFFFSMINNVFEPYSLEMLISLYMEIISEMFLFPQAVTLRLDGEVFKPAYAKGVSLEKYHDLMLEAAPITSNLNFRFFPTIMDECSDEAIGEKNHRLLWEANARILVPLSTGERLDHIVICFSPQADSIQADEKNSLVSLCSILNRALEMQHIKSSLMAANRELGDKVYSLTSLYKAAEVIFANTKIDETLPIILDMMMENYQSSVSSVFLHNFQDHRFELMLVKSALHNSKIYYSLATPEKKPDSKRVIINYRDSVEQRSVFLADFPEFTRLEEQLKPYLILQLISGDVCYGFITLSDRVTGQEYSQNDLDMLNLLVNSIGLAISNVMVYDQLEAKSLQLQQSLANIYAIQDVLLIIKQASNLDNFLSLLSSALEMGVGVSEMSVFVCRNNNLELLSGRSLLAEADIEAIKAIRSPALGEINLDNVIKKCLVLPIYHAEILNGYILVESFKDTAVDEGDNIQLLSIIAGIIGETFANLMEKKVIYPDNIMDFTQLSLYKLQEQVDYLLDLGLEANIIKINNSSPHAVVKNFREWAEGFIIHPQIGILVTDLTKKEACSILEPYSLDYSFIDEINMDTLYAID